MKKIMLIGTIGLFSAFTAFAQGYGRRVFKPGETTPLEPERVRPSQYDRTPEINRGQYDRTPGGGHLHMTPIAISAFTWGMPYGRNWAICGLRMNLGLPGITHQYESVYGLDIGLSGETFGESGGVLVNVFNNTARDMYGVAAAGLWNRALGTDSVALQFAVGFNSAEGLSGAQIGLVNRSHTLHGIQVGFYNIAVQGGGLQIGIWNDSGNGAGSPIIGIVY